MTRVAILQSNYIPWKGYFHIVNKVNHFVFLDEVQYTRRDWRNRNRIKCPEGTIWITVPNDGNQTKKISEVRIDNSGTWYEDHFSSLRSCYKRTKYYEFYLDFLENIYLKRKWEFLSRLNQFLIKRISEFLGIETSFHNSSEFELLPGKNEKIIAIVKQLNGKHYLTGPTARNYINTGLFARNGITLEFMDYSGYPVYRQPWGPFEHKVSILDLLFCTGHEAPAFIWGK